MRKTKKQTKRTIQISPRLFNGQCRVISVSRFPEAVKEGIRDIARTEGKSMSWVMEEVVIDYFSLPKPRYINKAK